MEGTEFRQTTDAQRDGQATRVVTATKHYATEIDDLWDAITNPERIPRWFSPVEGGLHLGGRYKLTGNASGEITRCDPPGALDLTWEFGDHVSWVRVRLEAGDDATQLRIEHEMGKDAAAEEHWNTYGPGATGVGWDLTHFALAHHIRTGEDAPDRNGDTTWATSAPAKAFMHACAQAWAQAHIAYGENTASATEAAARTAAFYTGD